MKKIVITFLSVIVIVIVVGIMAITAGLSDGKEVEVVGINLSDKKDGDYTGEYQHGRWTNTLTVHVKDQQITGIDIDKDVLITGDTDCSDEVFRRVIEQQDTQIDVVTGATVTTKAYLKAIENALNE